MGLTRRIGHDRVPEAIRIGNAGITVHLRVIQGVEAPADVAVKIITTIINLFFGAFFSYLFKEIDNNSPAKAHMASFFIMMKSVQIADDLWNSCVILNGDVVVIEHFLQDQDSGKYQECVDSRRGRLRLELNAFINQLWLFSSQTKWCMYSEMSS